MDDRRLRHLIEKHLDSSLTSDEREQLERCIAEDPALEQRIADEETLHRLARDATPESFSASFAQRVMEHVEEENALRRLMSAAKPAGFKPFFQTRVMRRIAEENQNTGAFLSQAVNEMISRLFPRVAVPAFAAASLVMAGNVAAAAADTPLVDALFGLPDDSPSEIAFMIWEE